MKTFNLTEGVRMIILEKGERVTKRQGIDGEVTVKRMHELGEEWHDLKAIPASELTEEMAKRFFHDNFEYARIRETYLKAFVELIKLRLQSNGLELREGACEKCWSDAHLRMQGTDRSQTECYHELLEERKDNPCEDDRIPLSNILINKEK
jgi:hypothetical protein